MLLTGITTVEDGLLKGHAAILKAVAGAVMGEAEAIMAHSKEHYCPVDTGVLRASGIVLPPEIRGSHVDVKLGYGGNASSYALEVHERLGVHHPVGQAKYLEVPFLHAATGMIGRVAAGAQSRLA